MSKCDGIIISKISSIFGENNKSLDLLYELYALIGYDKNAVDELIAQEVQNNIETSDNNMLSSEFILNILISKISDENKKLILCQYIDKYYKEDISWQDSITILENFCNIVDFLKIDNSFKIIHTLLSTSGKFYTIVKVLYNNYIVDDNYEKVIISDDIVAIINLFRELNDNYFAFDLGIKKVLTREEEVNLFKELEKAKEEKNSEKIEAIRKEIVQHNLLLVIDIAKKYLGRGLDYDDLFQEGTIGLLDAIDNFDYKKGFKLSAYATKPIHWHIKIALIEQARQIRIPGDKVILINKMRYIQRQLTCKLESIDQEIANEMGIPIDTVIDLKKISQEPVSYEKLVKKELTNSENISGIPLTRFSLEEKVIDDIFQKKLEEILKENLMTLSEREQEILKLRYGFVDGKCHSLEEIGNRFNISRQRINQIINKVLKYLKRAIDENINGEKNYIKNNRKRHYLNLYKRLNGLLPDGLTEEQKKAVMQAVMLDTLNVAHNQELADVRKNLLQRLYNLETGDRNDEIIVSKDDSKILDSFFCYISYKLNKEFQIRELFLKYTKWSGDFLHDKTLSLSEKHILQMRYNPNQMLVSFSTIAKEMKKDLSVVFRLYKSAINKLESWNQYIFPKIASCNPLFIFTECYSNFDKNKFVEIVKKICCDNEEIKKYFLDIIERNIQDVPIPKTKPSMIEHYMNEILKECNKYLEELCKRNENRILDYNPSRVRVREQVN